MEASAAGARARTRWRGVPPGWRVSRQGGTTPGDRRGQVCRRWSHTLRDQPLDVRVLRVVHAGFLGGQAHLGDAHDRASRTPGVLVVVKREHAAHEGVRARRGARVRRPERRPELHAQWLNLPDDRRHHVIAGREATWEWARAPTRARRESAASAPASREFRDGPTARVSIKHVTMNPGLFGFEDGLFDRPIEKCRVSAGRVVSTEEFASTRGEVSEAQPPGRAQPTVRLRGVEDLSGWEPRA